MKGCPKRLRNSNDRSHKKVAVGNFLEFNFFEKTSFCMETRLHIFQSFVKAVNFFFANFEHNMTKKSILIIYGL